MLPGLDFTEVIIVIVLALLVLGPKDLPLMMRKIGRFMARMRGLAAEFRTGFDELARQAELDELRKEVDALRRTTREGFSSVTGELTRPVQEMRDAMNEPAQDTPANPSPALEAGAQPTALPYDPEPPVLAPDLAIEPTKTAGGVR